jgi:vacuolar-type H+-ATPase subunit E/Vma4
MTTNEDSTGLLREEILVEAKREGEEAILRARQDAEAILAGAAAEGEQVRRDKLDQARKEAARRTELILATVPVETGRMREARVEALLGSIQEEARRRLLARDGFDYRKTIVALASDAIGRMAGVAFVLKLSEADAAVLGDGLAGEIAQRVGRPITITVSLEEENAQTGVVVEDGDARQVWDNRLTQRLERLWPEMRRRIAVEAAFVPKTGPEGDRL